MECSFQIGDIVQLKPKDELYKEILALFPEEKPNMEYTKWHLNRAGNSFTITDMYRMPINNKRPYVLLLNNDKSGWSHFDTFFNLIATIDDNIPILFGNDHYTGVNK